MPQEYIPVPVLTAQQIAQDCSKSWVVILAYDPVHGVVHTTTYGKSAEDKIHAAELGPVLNQAAGGFVLAAKVYEDFRDAALTATQLEELRLDKKRLDDIARLGIELAPRGGQWNCLIADTHISQRGVSCHQDLRTAIDEAVKELDASGETSVQLE